MHLTHTIERFLRPDSKGRISLGKMAEGVSGYKAIFDEETHRVILEPYAEVPLKEKWLYENKEALNKVKKGLKDSAAGKLKDLGSFSEHAKEK